MTGAPARPCLAGWPSIYKDLIACDDRTRQVIADVTTSLAQGRNCLVLTNWTGHLDKLADALRALGHDPVTLKGGMGARDRAAALARLTPQPGGPPLLAVATGPYAGEGFDCPPLGHPLPRRASRQQGTPAAGRRAHPAPLRRQRHPRRGPDDYHDKLTGVLASSLARRAPGYTSLGFPDPRKLPYTPSAGMTHLAQP